MYRKKLMRACLAGIMAATVVTQSVPAYAAEPTKQEAAKLRTITIQYQDENGIVGTYDLYAQPEDVAAVSAKVVKAHLPEGCELVNEQDNYEVKADGTVVVTVKNNNQPEKPVSKSVKINFYDEENGKQAAEVEVQNLAVDTAALGLKVVKSYLPEGYELVKEENSYAVSDGYVYVGVKPIKAEPEKPVSKSVKINFYDEENGKQAAEVEVQNLAADTAALGLKVVKSYLPEGYKLVTEENSYAIVDGYVYVGVKPIKAEKPEAKVTALRVIYKDEATQEVVGGETLTGGRQNEEGKYVFSASVDFNIPEGYELAVNYPDFELVEGEVSTTECLVKKASEFEYAKVTYVDADNGEYVVGYGTAKVEKGATYFNTSILTDVPYGYEIAEVGDMPIANGEAIVKVRKIDNVQEVTITYVHKTTGAVVGYGKLNAYKNEAYFNTSRLTDIPEGYVLADAGDMPIENGAATVYVYAATDMEELQPSTPVVPSKPVEPSKPEKPNKNEGTTTDDKKKDDKKDNKKDDKKTSAKTGDETNPIAAVLPAGISLAAILALLKKRK